MSATIERPEDAADRLWPVIVGGRYADVVEAFRDRDEQWRKSLLALATEWKTSAPASSGGYVAALEELAASLGGGA